mgnify:CR=1 FL=1
MATENAAWDGKSAVFFSYIKATDSLRVSLDSSSFPPGPLGRNYVTSVRNVYSTTNITTGGWVELISALSDSVNELDIFSSSAETLELGIGGVGVEARTLIITPGGNGRIPLYLPAGARISVRAISATANVGELDINFFK